MTRGEALAWLARMAMESRSLLYYEPGVRLVVDCPIGRDGRVVVYGDDPHAFDEVSFNGKTAWGYHIDPRA